MTTSNDTATVTTIPEPSPKKDEPVKNSRCDRCNYCNNSAHVGARSAAESLKLQWHLAHFEREMQVLPDGAHRYRWVAKGAIPSLKQFVRTLIGKGDSLAKDWLAHKHGSLNEVRNDKNKKRVIEEKMASKAARRKKKAQGGKTETAAPAK